MSKLRWKPTAGSLVSILTLTALWCGLWGDISVANVLAGLAIGLAVQLFLGRTEDNNRPSVFGIKPGPLLHLAWLVVVDLVNSTWSVAFEVLTPEDRTDETTIDVVLDELGRLHLLLLTVVITLTPGTAVADVDEHTNTLTLHLLHSNREEATRLHVKKLAKLAADALPFGPDNRSTEAKAGGDR